MAFTVRDYHDMVRLLDQHPEWQAELRRLLLADDFLALPAIVRDLAAAQERTEARLEQLAAAQQRTEARLEQLAAAQERTEAHLERLEATVQSLAAAQQRTEARLAELATDVRALTVGVQNLTAEVRQLADWQRGEAGRREGERYERNMARQAILLFNGGQGGTPDDPIVYQRLLGLLRQLPEPGSLTEEQNPFLADLIWWKDGHYAVVEVSLQVNDHDVTRAARRAETLQAANVQAIGVVIGERWLDDTTRRQAEAEAVQWRVRDDLSDGYLAFCRQPA